MATNQFKPFATGSGANITSQADWEALPVLLTGFQSGKASSAQINKAIRQASFVAAALAQFISDKNSADVQDNGNVATFVASFAAALNKQSQPLDATLSALAGVATGANKLPYFTGNDVAAQTDLSAIGRDIIGKADVAAVLTYLGLGEAAKRGVGTGVNQIPDMSSFTNSLASLGWQKLPGGLLIQWGIGGMAAGVSIGAVTFPITFPSALFAIFATDTGAANVAYGTTNRTLTGFSLTRTSSTGNVNGFYLAIGV